MMLKLQDWLWYQLKALCVVPWLTTVWGWSTYADVCKDLDSRNKQAWIKYGDGVLFLLSHKHGMYKNEKERYIQIRQMIYKT